MARSADSWPWSDIRPGRRGGGISFGRRRARHNQKINNVLSDARKEPPEAKAVRDLIAPRRKKGLNSPDVAPGTETGNDTRLASLTGYRAGKPDLHFASASHQGAPGERTDMTNPTTTRPAAIVSRRDFLRTGAAAAALFAAALFAAALFAAGRDDTPPAALIGYTEFRTDLPGGRHANVKT